MEESQQSEDKHENESVGTPVKVSVNKPSTPAVAPEAPAPAAPEQKTRNNKLLWGAVAVVLVVAVVGLCLALNNKNDGSGSVNFNENTSINTTEYQALFLSNGQVYFGKLSDLNHKYVTLHNIYYLQVQQNLQAGSGGNTSDGSKISLAKLGSELHGPEDKMYVSSDQVLFWENLKDSSQVVQAIHKYQGQ